MERPRPCLPLSPDFSSFRYLLSSAPLVHSPFLQSPAVPAAPAVGELPATPVQGPPAQPCFISVGECVHTPSQTSFLLGFCGPIFLTFSLSGCSCLISLLWTFSHCLRSESCPPSVLPQFFPVDGLIYPVASVICSVQRAPWHILALTPHLKHAARGFLQDSLPAPQIQHDPNPLPFQTVHASDATILGTATQAPTV